jgi:peroxiredoxin Q/BCP
LQDDKAKFDAAGAVLLGVNNNTIEAHQGYCQKAGFTFPILADVDLAMAKAYGAEKGGRTKRTVVVIDPGGTIVFYKPGMPTDDEILEALQ